MWRSLGRPEARDREARDARKPLTELPSSPPEHALPRPDGSRLQLLEDNSLLRWTQRSNGSWRKPELWPVDKDQLEWLMAQISKYQVDLAEKREAERVAKEEEAKRKRMEKLAQAPAAVAAAKAAAAAKAGGDVDVTERVAQLLSLREPPAEAHQADGDGVLQIDLEDGATIRWTKRPDGTWRKPEHRRAGWVDELEQAKYVPPTMRLLEGATNGATRAVLLLDPDYDRGPAVSKSYAQAQAPKAPRSSKRELWEPKLEVNGKKKEEPKGKHGKARPPEAEKKSLSSGAERYATKEDRKVDMELLPALTRLCVANGWQ